MDKNTTTVGVVGLGIMGGAISRNLAERGWKVAGHDLDPSRLEALAAAGGQPVGGVEELAEMAEVILTSLPNCAAAFHFADQLCASPAAPRVVLEMSTFRLEEKEQLRARLAAGGHLLLDCPISGTGEQAAHRDVVVFVSGDSEAARRCAPVFADFANAHAYLGNFGNGTKMKLVANLLVAVHNVASAEALALGIKAGLDPHQMIDLIGKGAGNSRILELRGPMMANAVYRPATMRLANWMKDMDAIAEFASALDCPTPLLAETRPIYERALEMGLEDADTAAVMEVVKDL